MHEPMIRIVSVASAPMLLGALAQGFGPLIVALIGLVLVAIIFYRLLFKSVGESSARLDRRWVTEPRPTEALQFRPSVAVLVSHRCGK